MSGDLLNTAVSAARAGAEVLLRGFRREARDLTAKAEHDWVSAADRESEDAIAGVLRSRYPDHQVLGEEGGLQGAADSGFQWIVDPLDGTTNFLRGLPFYCISIACRQGARTRVAVIYAPERGELFTAEMGGGAFDGGERMQVSSRPGLRGAFLATGFPHQARGALGDYLQAFGRIFRQAASIRRCGAAALDLAYTAAGIFDGFWEFRLSPWDTAAGALLIREAGGRVTNLDGGEEIFAGGNIVAGAPEVHRELLALLRQGVDEARLDIKAPPRSSGAAGSGAHRALDRADRDAAFRLKSPRRRVREEIEV